VRPHGSAIVICNYQKLTTMYHRLIFYAVCYDDEVKFKYYWQLSSLVIYKEKSTNQRQIHRHIDTIKPELCLWSQRRS